MSRLAKKPIIVPAGVSISQAGNVVNIKGPKGEINKTLPPYIIVSKEDGSVRVLLDENAPKEAKAFLGTSAAIIKGGLNGVSGNFEKKLEIEGVGYKAQLDGDNLVLSLGFTHQVRIPAPKGVSFKVEKNAIWISGPDKELVGATAATVRSKKLPEPYKGKGIHYSGEVIRRKAGKKAVASA